MVGLATAVVGYRTARESRRAKAGAVSEPDCSERVRACCEQLNERLTTMADGFIALSGTINNLSLRLADIATRIADGSANTQLQLSTLVDTIRAAGEERRS